MKHLIFLFSLILYSSVCFCQTQKSIGTDFINHLFTKNYTAAYQAFDDTVKNQLSINTLQNAAQQAEGQFGVFKKIISVDAVAQAPYTAYFYYSKFEGAKLDIKLVFSKANKIVGFFFVPHQNRGKEEKELEPEMTKKEDSINGIVGDWYGALDLGMMKLPMVLHLKHTKSGYTATMDSPKQGATGIPVPKASVRQDSLFLDMSNMKAKFSGVILTAPQRINGEFSQRGMSFPLVFTRKEPAPPKHPQEPHPPYPYHSEEVTFHNTQQDVTLAGTLTYPKAGSNFPAVILITGSGPQDRNEEILGHKPFLVIADYLTRQGIAVLRFDDRGVGESTGTFKGATTADFATDVTAAFDYLLSRPEIASTKIGLMGHSEGGAIAPMVASQNKKVDFIVLLAGPGVSGGQVLLEQQQLIAQAKGLPKAIIQANYQVNQQAYQLITEIQDSSSLREKLQNYFTKSLKAHPVLYKTDGLSLQKAVDMRVEAYMDPWMRFFIAYNPALTLEKVGCPVLALNGSRDLQVSAIQNLPAIRAALEKGGNAQITLKKLSGLNHLFQKSETGLPTEYSQIEMSFSPKALELIKDWILKTAD